MKDEKKSNITLWLVGFAVLLIAVFFGYRFMKKRQANKQIAPPSFDDPMVNRPITQKAVAPAPVVLPTKVIQPVQVKPPAPAPMTSTDKMILARATKHAEYLYKGLVLNDYRPFSDDRVKWATIKAEMMVNDGVNASDLNTAYKQKYGYSHVEDFKRFASNAMTNAWNARVRKGRV